jgi:hypothetical protein
VAAALACSPVMAEEVASRSLEERNVAVTEQTPVATVQVNKSTPSSFVDTDPVLNIRAQKTVLTIGYKPDDVQFAIYYEGPTGISAFQEESLIDLKEAARFEEFDFRLKTHIA